MVLVSTHRAKEFRSVLTLSEGQKVVEEKEIDFPDGLVEVVALVEDNGLPITGFELFNDHNDEAVARKVQFSVIPYTIRK